MMFLRKSYYIFSLLIVLALAFPLPIKATEMHANIVTESYKLGAGDRLKVIVFGEESLSGEFEIDGQGMVALPLVGNMKAGGIDARKFETDVAVRLKDGYLVNPRV